MKKSHRSHHRKMCKRGYRRKQSRLWPMNRKDKQLLMKLNFAAGILHVHGINEAPRQDGSETQNRTEETMKPSDELAKRFDEHDRSFEQTRQRVENLRSSIKVGVYAALTILITMAIYTMAQTVFQMVIK